jgi:enoyl-CoA hydratase
MSYQNILTEVHGDGARRCALIRLNRPKALNALNDALMDELGAALQASMPTPASAAS